MRKNSEIEAIIFDLGGVVFGISLTPIIKSWAKSAGVHPQKIAENFGADSHYERFETSEITPEEYRAHVCSVLEVDLSPEDFDRGWNSIYLDVLPGMESLIKELREHVRLVVLTNTNQIHAPVWRERYSEVLALFEKIFASHEIEARKPDAEAFQIVLDYLEIVPEKTIFFDDNEKNVRGAEALGIQSFIVSSPDDVVEGLRLNGIEA